MPDTVALAQYVTALAASDPTFAYVHPSTSLTRWWLLESSRMWSVIQGPCRGARVAGIKLGPLHCVPGFVG